MDTRPEHITTLVVASGLGAIAALGLPGCAEAPPCAASTACPPSAVCQADGACAPLDPHEARFAQVRWLAAADYGVTSRDGEGVDASSSDVLVVGGRDDAHTYMLFRPLPRDVGIGRAVLSFSPHDTWTGAGGPATVAVERVAPFVGARLTRRSAPRPTSAPLAAREVLPSARHVRVDVTAAVARTLDDGSQTLAIRLRNADDAAAALRIASPRATRTESRPRLELWLR